MQVVRLNGIHIHCEMRGEDSAPVVVFVNSLGTDFRVWDRLLACLGGGIRTLRYDKRGHGLTDAPDAPYALDDHIGDLEALMDHFEVKGATVCGLSVGGMIAQGLAVKRPDLVARLILSDTAHKIGPADVWDTRIQAIGEAGSIDVLADAVMERWFSDGFRREHGDEVMAWRAMLTRTPLEGYIGTCYALRDADLTESSKTIVQPTLCLGGAEDGSTPPALMREMTALIDGAAFHEIPGAGHLPCVEEPDAVARLMTAFMEDN